MKHLGVETPAVVHPDHFGSRATEDERHPCCASKRERQRVNRAAPNPSREGGGSFSKNARALTVGIDPAGRPGARVRV